MTWLTQLLNTALRFWEACGGLIWNLLTTPPSQFKGGIVWDVMVSINSVFQYVAYALLILFFGISVAKETTNINELKRPENVFRLFIRYAVAKAFITYNMYIMDAVYTIGAGIVRKITASSEWLYLYGGSDAELPSNIANQISNADLIDRIPLTIIVIIGFLVIIALSLVALLAVYGRFFKIYIYTALAPIPIAAMSGEVTQNHGWQFVKSYVGICLEGAVIALACVIYTKMGDKATISPMFFAYSELGFVVAYIVEVIFNMLIMIGIMKSSNQIVREMTNL